MYAKINIHVIIIARAQHVRCPLRALGPGAEPQPSVSVSTLNVPSMRRSPPNGSTAGEKENSVAAELLPFEVHLRQRFDYS